MGNAKEGKKKKQTHKKIQPKVNPKPKITSLSILLHSYQRILEPLPKLPCYYNPSVSYGQRQLCTEYTTSYQENHLMLRSENTCSLYAILQTAIPKMCKAIFFTGML